MKTKNSYFKTIRRVLCMSLALIAVLSLLHPVTAQAKAKNITLKHQMHTYSKSVAEKKATAVKKGVTYNITMKVSGGMYYSGYAKFKAPKAGKYTITISNFKINANMFKECKIYPEIADVNSPKNLTAASVMRKKYVEPYLDISNKKRSGWAPTKNSGTIELKKNQMLYLRFYCDDSLQKSNKVTTKLVIK